MEIRLINAMSRESVLRTYINAVKLHYDYILIDCIGGAIYHIRNIHKYARPEDVPAHTMFVIITDGYENASRIYDSTTVKAMIEEQKKEHGWEFLFIGANIDAVETARNFGIDAERAVAYHADAKGTAVV